MHPSLLQTLVTQHHHSSIKYLLFKVVVKSCTFVELYISRDHIINKVCIIKKNRGHKLMASISHGTRHQLCLVRGIPISVGLIIKTFLWLITLQQFGLPVSLVQQYKYQNPATELYQSSHAFLHLSLFSVSSSLSLPHSLSSSH